MKPILVSSLVNCINLFVFLKSSSKYLIQIIDIRMTQYFIELHGYQFFFVFLEMV